MMNRRNFLQAAAAAPLAAAQPRPNILIITTDQHAADAMSCRQGSRYIHTPHIDSLAANGRVFTRAYCANPLCVPSRTSLYTGRYPVETGIETNGQERLDPKRYPLMGAIFQRAGYATGYFGKWHLPFDERTPEVHGFAAINRGKSGGDAGTASAAADFVRAKRDKPFLLVASLVNPHNICQWARSEELPEGSVGTPPPLAQCPPLRANTPPQQDEPDIMTLMRRSYHATDMFPVGKFGEKEWREYIWGYYRMIEKVDAEIGRILAALQETGQVENTLVVFSADHGDCQGAHGWNQKTVLYEEAALVPFIFSRKGATRAGVSHRLVHTGVDLLPTLCAFAGIAPPPELPGLNLRAEIESGETSEQRQFVVVSDKMVQGAKIDGRLPEPDGRMLRSQHCKYTVFSEGQRRESLVDLEKDPGETVNLAADPKHRAMLDAHRKMMAEWGRKFGDKFPYVAG